MNRQEDPLQFVRSSEEPQPIETFVLRPARYAVLPLRAANSLSFDAKQTCDFLSDVVPHLPTHLVGRYGLLLGLPIYWLSPEQREEERKKVLKEMLENKAELIKLLKECLEAETNEDEREKISEELYEWLQEDLKERLPGTAAPVPAPPQAGTGDIVTAEDKRRWNTPENVAALARVIMSEASIGNAAERTAVGYTVLNRMQRNGTNSVGDVHGAFARNQDPSREVTELAAAILRCDVADNSGGATHFYSPRSMPNEGEPTGGFDVGGGLEQTEGVTGRNYRPTWAGDGQFPRVDVPGARPSHYKFHRAPGNGPVR